MTLTKPVKTRALLKSYKVGAAMRGYEFSLTDAEADALFRSPCHYCGYARRNKFNGIDRVDNTAGYVSTNVVPCCIWCNGAKGRKLAADFLEWLRWVQSNQAPMVVKVERLQLEREPVEPKPNCCPHCGKVITDAQVKTMNARMCLSKRKDRGGKPALAKILKRVEPTEADRAWARQEIAARGIRVDYNDPDFQG